MPRAPRHPDAFALLHLTKSRYLAGLQCDRRLWLAVHRRGRAAAPAPGLAARFESGAEVGRLARRLFPGGVLVPGGTDAFESSCARTRQLMVDTSVPAIFEAAFEYAGVRIRVDVLERAAHGWRLIEAKASTRVKEVHLDDLAIQHFVLEGCGVPVVSCELVHVDSRYVRGEGEIDWSRYFGRSDQSAAIAERQRETATRVLTLYAGLDRPEPEVGPGPHCRKPHVCPFAQHCQAKKPDDWILTLPNLGSRGFRDLEALGVDRITEIPEGHSLAPLHRRIRDVLLGRAPVYARGLPSALSPFGPPAFYLDFEAFSPALPRYPGTRPYEAIPFQWSLHHDDGRDRLAHAGFLADGRRDPRREVAESLLAALGKLPVPVVVYSDYERAVLTGLERLFPDLARQLARVRNRLVDLHRVLRVHVYHPEFRGSFSLKRVAAVLVPGFGYEDLDGVADGATAAAAFERVASGAASASEESDLRSAFLAYCERDTRALVEVHRVLRAECR